ncbi:MAG: DUF58 domain-containing protein [Chloroflexota bacterium]|nr:DUF58 domain-containing protein [Chloroflexota bacterium]
MGAFKLLVLIATALVFGEMTGWPIADHLALALTALLISSWLWSRFSLRGLSLTRETASDRARVGQELREVVEVRNAGRVGKLWLEVIDHSSLPHHSVSRVLHVPGRAAVPWEAATRCIRRGRFRVGPLTLRAGDPLGLFPVRILVPEAHEVIVYPAIFHLRDFPLPTGTLAGGSTRERRNPFVTSSVAGIRDYTPSDAFNRISWAATARLGRLMVKEFDLDPTADVWFVLDLAHQVQVHATRPLQLQPDARGEWPVEAWLDSTEEYAVTIVASLARHFLAQRRNVGLIATGAHLEVIAADRSDRQEVKLLETLAVVRADGHVPLAEILVAEGRRFTRQSVVIVVTPSVDEAWITALAEIVGRRVHASAVIVEPETFGDAPTSLLAVSRLVAAGIPVHLVKYGDNIAAALAAAQNAGGATVSSAAGLHHG